MISTKTQAFLAAIAAAPALVSAHGHVVSITVNGETLPGFEPGNPSADSVGWSTTVTDNGFVLADSLSSPDIVCHKGATSAASSASVAAGDTISIKWDTWPETHVGPIIDYLAACNGDCAAVDKTALEFFKIDEDGLLDGSTAPGRWASDIMIEDGFTWETTIPASLAPGSYVLRHEMIALHEGNRENGAQMYPQCINIEVTGSGTSVPAGVVATELYTASDAGIFFNPYRQNFDDYVIPGPAVASIGGGSNPAPAPAPAPSAPADGGDAVTTTTVAAPTTLVTATSQPVAQPSQPANGGGNSQGQALYSQCGGKEYTGATACAEGVCTKLNDYYFQCIPASN